MFFDDKTLSHFTGSTKVESNRFSFKHLSTTCYGTGTPVVHQDSLNPNLDPGICCSDQDYTTIKSSQRISLAQTGLALKNPPKKPTQKTQKNPPKKNPLKMGFWVFLGFF
jgi:hypothetical protein